MASVLTILGSDLCCGLWPNSALNHRPTSSPGFCNLVRGKLSCVTDFGYCWFLGAFPKEGKLHSHFCFAFWDEKSWTRLSLQLLLWPLSCDISAANMTSPKRRMLLSCNPPVNYYLLGFGTPFAKPSVAVLVCLPNFPSGLVVSVNERMSLVFCVGSPASTSIYATTSALYPWLHWMIFLCQKVTCK